MLNLSKAPLIDAQKIATRIGELGKQIGREFDFDTIVGAMTGSFIFVADLCRAMPKKKAQIKFIKASSYGDSTESSQKVKVSGLDSIQVEGARILLVDDILGHRAHDAGTRPGTLRKGRQGNQDLRIPRQDPNAAKCRSRADYGGF
jgi:Hypoxanthine-guanine phosphoribosyltransferase